MSDETITKIALALIAGIPAVIAAISSLKNGHTLRRKHKENYDATGGKSLPKKPRQWYHPK